MTAAGLSRSVIALALVGLLPFLLACNLLGGGEPTPAPTPIVASVATPQPTQVPTATATPTPRPTPTPTPNLASAEVERIVFLKVRSCADQISSGRGSNIEIKAIPTYDQGQRRWATEVVSNDGTLSFGRWAVLDTSRDVSPLDDVATAITTPDIICAEPASRISKAPVPPLFSTPARAPAIATPEEAELLVWVTVYGCYAEFPRLESFNAYAYGQESWVVEGKSAETQYGLWRVDGITGEVSTLDRNAREAANVCTLRSAASFPPAFTSGQAELRVWAAVYDCFTPKPKRESFKSYVDSPQRWLVEAKGVETVEVQVERVVGGVSESFTELRSVVVHYGFWLVDTATASIQPWDQLARDTVNSPTRCYKVP